MKHLGSVSSGLVVVALGLAAQGCGGGATYQTYGSGRSTVTAYPNGPAGASVQASVTPSSGYTSGGAAEASVRADVPAAPSVAPHPATRQGLATEWGESRHSEMSYTPFVRANPSQPFDVASIYYNDHVGSAQQAVYHASVNPVAYVGAASNGVRLSLRDESGRPLPGYFAGDRLFVVGQAGQRYSIVIENTTAARFEAVVSVDGLDVINGRPADLSARGYLLNPYAQVAIDGFRQSSSTVAAFRFGSVGDSYAAQTGDARNVGVIGLALFAEQGAVFYRSAPSEIELRETANPFPGSFATPPPRRHY